MSKFAALGNLLKGFSGTKAGRAGGYAMKNALPRNIADAAMDWGPDLAFAGLAGMSLPNEYASGLEKIGWGAEDAALGIGGSMLGRAVATAGLMPVVGPRRARQLGTWIGGMGGGMVGAMHGPRLYGGTLDRRAQEAAQQMQSERDQMLLYQGMQMSGPSHGLELAASTATGRNPYEALALEAAGIF